MKKNLEDKTSLSQKVGSEKLSLENFIKRDPLRFFITRLRREGTQQVIQATKMTVYGGNIYVVVPGAEKGYISDKAIISWNSLMNINMLLIERNSSKGYKEVDLGRLEFIGLRERVSKFVRVLSSDPNLILYSGGELIEINQVQGVPRLYVEKCKIEYENS